jgi:DNA mismatch repair ATPase MutS
MTLKEEKPVMREYRRLRNQYPDSVLLLKLGGFHILLERDAYLAGRLLRQRVTVSTLGGEPAPGSGIPSAAAVPCAQLLAEQGYAVAVCEPAGDGRWEAVKVLRPAAGTPMAEAVKDADYAAFLAELGI